MVKTQKNNNKFSIILPAFNEEKTIAKVIKAACVLPAEEIIVVDDGSTDNTPKIVSSFVKRNKKLILIRHKKNKGVGEARKTGIKVSKSPILLFFDTDISNINSQMMENIINPVLKDKADFVMAAFENEGRVTELVAKPLLKLCFSELAYLKQPISGQFATKKEFLFPQRIDDSMLGILIDAYLAGARITETYIGLIEHNHHQLDIKKRQAFYECQACLKRFTERYYSFTPIHSFSQKIFRHKNLYQNFYQRDEF